MTSVAAQHWKLERRHHLKTPSARGRGGLAKGEVCFRGSVCGNRNRHRLLSTSSSAFMPRNNRVSSRGNALDRVAAILGTNCEERVLQDADVGFHPGMLIALDRHQHFR